MTGRMFLSYSTQDREVAEIVCAALERNNRSVWMAPRDVPPGMPYPEAIMGAIRDCDSAVLILSASSNKSAHVLREVGTVCGAQKTLYVVRVETVEPSDGLAYFASLIQWVEAPREKLLVDPVGALRALLEPERQMAPAEAATPGKAGGSSAPRPAETLAGQTANFSALAEAQRKMLTAFGTAVLAFVCQRPNPAEPIKRRDLLAQLVAASPSVFEGLSGRQFDGLLHDAVLNGCVPGLLEDAAGVYVVEENIAVKLERNALAKNLIARHAVRLVKSRSVIAIDGGSTTLPIVNHLLAEVESGELEDMVIVTNSLTNAHAISEFMSVQGWTDDTASLTLFMCGGYVRPNTHATTWVGQEQRERQALQDELMSGGRKVDIAFVGANGFDLDSGLTMGSEFELGFKRFALESATDSYIVADGSKAGTRLPVQIASWDDRFTLLTNVLTGDVLGRLDELILAGRIIEVRE